MTVSAAQVKELRNITGAGMMECKEALIEAKGDLEAATQILRKRGLSELKRRSGRIAEEGVIDSYVHFGGRIGVLVEVNCETDFVARNEEFKRFAHDIAMHIAAANPLYISRDEVPSEVIDKEREIYKSQALEEGKPEKIVDKIVEGKLEKFFQSVCLLEQPFIKNTDLTVETYLGEVAGKIGENIVIRRFVHFELGGTT
ncbi:MAG: translation elongation factor Ts [Actinomycetota bacterium]|nr:translation elongation factor Ts [Actinomycetota bacterium]